MCVLDRQCHFIPKAWQAPLTLPLLSLFCTVRVMISEYLEFQDYQSGLPEDGSCAVACSHSKESQPYADPGEMAQSVKHLEHKNGDPGSIPSILIKIQVWWHMFIIPMLGRQRLLYPWNSLANHPSQSVGSRLR